MHNDSIVSLLPCKIREVLSCLNQWNIIYMHLTIHSLHLEVKVKNKSLTNKNPNSWARKFSFQYATWHTTNIHIHELRGKECTEKKPMSSAALQHLPSFNTRISHSGYKTLLPVDSAQFPLYEALKAIENLNCKQKSWNPCSLKIWSDIFILSNTLSAAGGFG